MSASKAMRGVVQLGCLAVLAVCLVAGVLRGGPAKAELRGHGGPVRGVAVGPDDTSVLTGSFDQSAVVWSLRTNAAERVLRFHAGAVNAVAFLPDGTLVTGGEDGKLALWAKTATQPTTVFALHEAAIAAIDVAPNGRSIATASWDGTAKILTLDGTPPRVLSGHQGTVNAVVFLEDGRVATVGSDASLRLWPLIGEPLSVKLPTSLNVVRAVPSGLAVAGADGVVRLLSLSGEVVAEIEASPLPIPSMAVSPDGKQIAVGRINGAVALIDLASRQVTSTLIGAGLPIWSLAFSRDGRHLLTGGGDRVVRQWDVRTGEPVGEALPLTATDPLAAFQGERGAEVFRACAACHTLTKDGGNRAGPTLHAVFGRKIASVPDYAYSDDFRKLDIVWTRESIGRLFTLGPSVVTPGTKMPEQRVGNDGDREALLDFLEKATR